VDRHPSGRFRFSFRVADLTPGNYLVRVAFTIRDSGHEPSTCEGPFTIRAAAGYVPPRTETEHKPIPLNRDDGAPVAVDVTEADDTYNWDAEDTTGTTPSAEAPAAEPIAAAATAAASAAPPEPTGKGPTPISLSTMPLPVPVDAGNEPALPTHPGVEAAEEPEYRGAGRWSELPLPASDARDLPASERTVTDETPREQGPIGATISRLLDLIRGDWYYLFFGGASLVIVLLLAALWLLP